MLHKLHECTFQLHTISKEMKMNVALKSLKGRGNSDGISVKSNLESIKGLNINDDKSVEAKPALGKQQTEKESNFLPGLRRLRSLYYYSSLVSFLTNRTEILQNDP